MYSIIKTKKILSNKFNQGVKDLNFENCKKLMKEIKENTNKWKRILCLWIRRI